MAIETRLTIRIEEEKRKAFQDKLKEDGKTATEVLIAFIDQYMGLANSTNKVDKVTQIERRLQRVEEILEERLGESAA